LGQPAVSDSNEGVTAIATVVTNRPAVVVAEEPIGIFALKLVIRHFVAELPGRMKTNTTAIRFVRRRVSTIQAPSNLEFGQVTKQATGPQAMSAIAQWGQAVEIAIARLVIAFAWGSVLLKS
jgi:hypothetical protein